MKTLRNHGIDRTKPGYRHYLVGFNYRKTNLQTAIGVTQLEKVDCLIEFKKIDWGYSDLVKGNEEFVMQKEFQTHTRYVGW